MSYLLIVLSFPDLIGESRGKNLKNGFPIKTFGNDEKADICYAGVNRYDKNNKLLAFLH